MILGSKPSTRCRPHPGFRGFWIGVAYKPPQLVKGPECQGACEYAWDREWWAGLAKYILHPQWMATGSIIKQQLEVADIPGICESCKGTTAKEMDMQGAFGKDKGIIKQIIVEVKQAHCGDLTPPQFAYHMSSYNYYN